MGRRRAGTAASVNHDRGISDVGRFRPRRLDPSWPAWHGKQRRIVIANLLAVESSGSRIRTRAHRARVSSVSEHHSSAAGAARCAGLPPRTNNTCAFPDQFLFQPKASASRHVASACDPQDTRFSKRSISTSRRALTSRSSARQAPENHRCWVCFSDGSARRGRSARRRSSRSPVSIWTTCGDQRRGQIRESGFGIVLCLRTCSTGPAISTRSVQCSICAGCFRWSQSSRRVSARLSAKAARCSLRARRSA